MKYKINDILINKDGGKRKILEVLTQTYIVSSYNDFDSSASSWTQHDLDFSGFALHDEWSPESLKVNQEYWFINNDGTCCRSWWDGGEIDQFRLKTKNIFKDEASAEARLKEIMES